MIYENSIAGQVDEHPSGEWVSDKEYWEFPSTQELPPLPKCDASYSGGRFYSLETMQAYARAACASLTPTAPQAASQQVGDEVKQIVRDAVAGALSGLYYCGRVWSAWSVGTMSEDDFSPADEDGDIIENVTDAAMNAMTLALVSQGAPQAATTPSPRCTCPSGDGSLSWPCPAHPPEASTASASTIKTWQERCGDTGPMPSLDQAARAMKAEIADLRAALARAPLPAQQAQSNGGTDE